MSKNLLCLGIMLSTIILKCVSKKILHFLVNWIIMNSHKIFSHSHLKVFLSFTVIVLLRCFCKTVPAKVFHLGLPWWSNGEESTCHCRAHRFDPWSGIPQATGNWACTPQLLSLCLDPRSQTTEPKCSNSRACIP